MPMGEKGTTSEDRRQPVSRIEPKRIRNATANPSTRYVQKGGGNGNHRVIIAGAGARSECGEVETRAEWDYIGVGRTDTRLRS